jgi:hypothetical protein
MLRVFFLQIEIREAAASRMPTGGEDLRIIRSHTEGPKTGVIQAGIGAECKGPQTTQQHELTDPTVSNHSVYGS